MRTRTKHHLKAAALFTAIVGTFAALSSGGAQYVGLVLLAMILYALCYSLVE